MFSVDFFGHSIYITGSNNFVKDILLTKIDFISSREQITEDNNGINKIICYRNNIIITIT